jgi:hypothetical protein
MNHKRKRSKARRAGCLLCKPFKLPAVAKANRARDREVAIDLERVAYEGGRLHDRRHLP